MLYPHQAICVTPESCNLLLNEHRFDPIHQKIDHVPQTARTITKGHEGFIANAVDASPCNIAIYARVIPHIGQRYPVSSGTIHIITYEFLPVDQ